MKSNNTIPVKVHALTVLAYPSGPFAVVVADVGRGASKVRYVHLDHEVRSDMSQKLGERYGDFPGRLGVAHADAVDLRGAPAGALLVRGHAISADDAAVDRDELRERAASASWSSAEGQWVRADVAGPVAAAMLRAWREANPVREGVIRAPSWRVLVGVQALAVAAGLPVPQAESDEDRVAA